MTGLKSVRESRSSSVNGWIQSLSESEHVDEAKADGTRMVPPIAGFWMCIPLVIW